MEKALKTEIKKVKGFSSAYLSVCNLKLLPNIDGTWITIQDDACTSITIKLSDLPQEPKTGHWIEIDEEPHEVWECDHCGFVIDGSGCIDPYDYRDTYKFCPNCGAKMDDVPDTNDGKLSEIPTGSDVVRPQERSEDDNN